MRQAIRTFSPGHFALVAATGIVSLAAHFCGHSGAATVLLWINVLAYGVIGALLLTRVVLHPQGVGHDFAQHGRGATFLTVVVGTSVLGSQLVILASAQAAGLALWLLAVCLWAVLLYTFFATMTVVETKPPLEAGINGSWLLAVVSTESLCVLGTLVAPGRAHAEAILFVSLLTYLVGAMLYFLLMAEIFYRWMFLSMPAEKMTPPYWINMGALAVTTLSGSRLLLCADAWPLLRGLTPFLTGFTLFFWAVATWWIPLLLLMGFWRHVVKRVPIVYDPQYWTLVFPIGMYTVATDMLERATGITLLRPIPALTVYAALAAWLLTFAGLLRGLARQFSSEG